MADPEVQPRKPRLVGPSESIPGAFDVESADGTVRPVAPHVLRGLGLEPPKPSTDGPAGKPDDQPQGNFLQGTNATQGPGAPVAATPEASPQLSAAQQAAQAEFEQEQQRLATDPAAQRVAEAGGIAAPANPLAPVTQQDVAITPGRVAAVERAASQRDAAAAEQARQQRIQQLFGQAARMDNGAAVQLRQMALQGDQDAQAALNELAVQQRAGTLPRAGGGGGARQQSVQTDTRRFTGPARPPTPQEAAEMRRLQAEQDDIEREQMLGIASAVDADANALEQSARLMERADARMRQLQQRQQLAEQARQQELRRRQVALDQLADEAARARVEPGRVLAKGNTTARFSAALGMLLGGFGDAIAGGNSGLQTTLSIIDRAIDRDIEAQRAELATKQQAVGNSQRLLATARARFGDEQAAEAATRDAMLGSVQRQIEALQRDAQSQAQDAQLRQAMAQIEARRNALRQQALQAGLGEREVVVQEQIGTRAGGGGGRNVNFEALERAPEVSAEERERLAAQRVTLENTLGEVDRALELLDETNATGPIGSLFSGASAEARELERTLGRIATPEAIAAFGALGNRDQLDIIADLNGLTIDTRADEIRRNLQRLRAKTRESLEATELGVGEEAVQEREAREPEVRERVTRAEGRAEDVAPSFRPAGGGE